MEGVLGHEIAHVANGDMVTMTLVQGVVNAFTMFLARVVAFFVAQLFRRDEEEGGVSHLVYFVATLVFDIAFSILGSVVVAWFSRLREFRADAGGAQLAGRDRMIGALEALQRTYGIVDPAASQAAVQTLKISGHPTGLMRFFSTHPPLETRIARLKMWPYSPPGRPLGATKRPAQRAPAFLLRRRRSGFPRTPASRASEASCPAARKGSGETRRSGFPQNSHAWSRRFRGGFSRSSEIFARSVLRWIPRDFAAWPMLPEARVTAVDDVLPLELLPRGLEGNSLGNELVDDPLKLSVERHGDLTLLVEAEPRPGRKGQATYHGAARRGTPRRAPHAPRGASRYFSSTKSPTPM